MESGTATARGYESAPLATWTTEGILWNQQIEPGHERFGQCRCCGPRGHVFAYGVNLPGTVPGVNGPVPAQPRDWLSQILHEHRFSPGARVRITVELLPAGPDHS